MSLEPWRVFCARAPVAGYVPYPGPEFPELPAWARVTTALVTLRSLLIQAGLDARRLGTADWNPLGEAVRPGDRVVVKPNWVRHRNGTDQGLECLVTHTDVIEAVTQYLVKARPRSIIVGDAPVQGCDFAALMTSCRVASMVERFRTGKVEIMVRDFRRTIMPRERLGAGSETECRPLRDYVLFDLGIDSCLEAITTPRSEFRVTMYDPDVLKRTHAPGRHQYLIAREVIEADVVLNLPKLKTHKKAGLTGALKNLVGVNGHKEYLPHHRKGGSLTGGDCYPGRSRLKGFVEALLDATNRARGPSARRCLAQVTQAGMALGRLLGADDNYDGSWHGNDTVWRMCLDIQRAIHYGRVDGSLGDRPQRRVLTLTDAIIAGQGEGPLSPAPVDLGMMTLGANTPALDWVHALIMGLAPDRIPLTQAAFSAHRYRLADFLPDAIAITLDGEPVTGDDLFFLCGRRFRPPRGWHDEASWASAAVIGSAVADRR